MRWSTTITFLSLLRAPGPLTDVQSLAAAPSAQVEWDKGCALAHLLGALGLDAAPDVLPIYIGDDRTDEDAFRLLATRPAGFGILVSTRVRATIRYVYMRRCKGQCMAVNSNFVCC